MHSQKLKDAPRSHLFIMKLMNSAIQCIRLYYREVVSIHSIYLHFPGF